jgi:hypothetical protein
VYVTAVVRVRAETPECRRLVEKSYAFMFYDRPEIVDQMHNVIINAGNKATSVTERSLYVIRTLHVVLFYTVDDHHLLDVCISDGKRKKYVFTSY